MLAASDSTGIFSGSRPDVGDLQKGVAAEEAEKGDVMTFHQPLLRLGVGRPGVSLPPSAVLMDILRVDIDLERPSVWSGVRSSKVVVAVTSEKRDCGRLVLTNRGRGGTGGVLSKAPGFVMQFV
jgi:hypothetical protein